MFSINTTFYFGRAQNKILQEQHTEVWCIMLLIWNDSKVISGLNELSRCIAVAAMQYIRNRA